MKENVSPTKIYASEHWLSYSIQVWLQFICHLKAVKILKNKKEHYFKKHCGVWEMF